jgi:transposase
MKLHANARTCPKSRQVMVRRFLAGRPREILAAEFAVSTRTVSKWVARYRAEGELGLLDRSSAPRRVQRTDPDRVEAIAALRRLRFSGPEIAELLGLPLSTTSGVLKRIGMGKLGRLGLERGCPSFCVWGRRDGGHGQPGNLSAKWILRARRAGVQPRADRHLVSARSMAR